MIYENIVTGKFISRPNRFIAEVEINGHIEKAHVKNTGRCKELLIPGVEIYLEDFYGKMKNRKMRYSLIAVKKGNTVVNIDSAAPNKLVLEALQNGSLRLPGLSEFENVKPEAAYGNSRFDFYIKDTSGKEGYIEVKGCTLEENGIARFPDAPTERGLKHINELISVSRAGMYAAVIFVIQLKGVSRFEPNFETHPEFGFALRNALEENVNILCYDCVTEPKSIYIDAQIEYVI